MDKTLREILIIFVIILTIAVSLFFCKPTYAQTRVTAIETSLNPHDKNFCLLWNDQLSVQSIEGNLNFLRMFNKTPDYSQELNFYFVLEKNYYQIWLPSENLFFTVQSTGNTPVNYHLEQFCNILKLWKEKLTLTSSKNNSLCHY